ncbi:MAG: hypothetical protein OHK005_20980 [Candidatus Methylacidiphilales bacterium]
MSRDIVFAALFLPIVPIQAATLVTWNFDGTFPGTAGTIVDLTGSVESVASASVSGASGHRQTGSTITNLPSGGGSGSGLYYVAPYETGTAHGGVYNASGFSTSPSDSSYMSFSLTLSGSIDPSVAALVGIEFDLAKGGYTGPRGVEVTYRIGTSGFFTSLNTTAVPTNVPDEYGRFSFILVSPAALTSGDVIEFRLRGYAPGPGQAILVDNVTITATAIPEPSTFALILAAGGMLLFFRRRARAS